LARAPGRAASQSIRILIAESLVRDQDYLGARHAYLLAWREAPGTLLGGSALYTAASLELERLGHAAEAARRLRLYLASYPKGSQREGSYYLLHRSLVRLGRTEEARQVADAYRREFPAGRYVLPDRP
jgi:TolA-binding protein